VAESVTVNSLNQPNDLWIDPAGGVYFSDPIYGRAEQKQDGECVYYVTPDRQKITRVIDDMVRPNGLVGTPDSKTLYVTDHAARQTYKYVIEQDGSLSQKSRFAPVGADGMKRDSEGNLYLAEKGILVYSSAGKHLETIDVPAHPLDLILCRPTRDSVTLCLLVYEDAEGFVAYGTEPGQFARQTRARKFRQGEPVVEMIGSLQPDTQYYYQLRVAGLPYIDGTFHTQRAAGSPFTFTTTADSHLDERVSTELYQRTLANALSDAPDFHIDLGDTFMTEKHDNRANATRQYLAQRYYFGQLCRSAPLFLVLGNHDGENPRGRDNEADSLAV
jgi:hypothetical protein